MNNNTMNNDNRTNRSRDSSSTPFRRRIQSLKDTTRKAANTARRKWNEYYDWLTSYVPPTSLKGSALRNNDNRTYILDEPFPHIGVETLRPTPFRRRIQSLKDTTRKVVNKVKKKWNLHRYSSFR